MRQQAKTHRTGAPARWFFPRRWSDADGKTDFGRQLSLVLLPPILLPGVLALILGLTYMVHEYMELQQVRELEIRYLAQSAASAYRLERARLSEIASITAQKMAVQRAIAGKDFATARAIGEAQAKPSKTTEIILAHRDGTALNFGGKPPVADIDPTWLFEAGDLPEPTLFVREFLGHKAIFSAITVFRGKDPIGYVIALSEQSTLFDTVRKAINVPVEFEIIDRNSPTRSPRFSDPNFEVTEINIADLENEPRSPHRLFVLRDREQARKQIRDNFLVPGAATLLTSLALILLCLIYVRRQVMAPALAISNSIHRISMGESGANLFPRENLVTSPDLIDALRRFQRQSQRITDLQIRLKGVVDNAADAIIAADRHWVIIDINASGREMFGSNAMTGQSLLPFVPGIVGAVEQAGRNRRVQLLARRSDDAVFFAEAIVAEVDEGGNGFYLATITDVSHRRAAEAAERRMREELETLVTDRTRDLMKSREHLRQTVAKLEDERLRAEDAMRAKTQFLAVVSHEIRTPMNGVLGMARLLLGGPLEGAQRERVQAVISSGEALLAILDNILDIAKLEANRLDVEVIDFDLLRVIETTGTLMGTRAEEKKLAFSLDVASDIPRYVKGDPTRLRQVLMNILGNAIKFSEAGQITLTVRRIPGSPDTEDQLEICVSDTGIGISPEGLTKLFESFSQADATISRRFGGTGLGLAISRRLVELMGGSLTARSTLGKGSTFTILVPCIPGVEPVQALQPVAEPLPEVRKLHILIAEDHPINQMVAEQFLVRQGHKVTAVEDGQAAIDAIKQGDFDLVLMDLQMPGVDGLAATREIRKFPGAKARIPIIAMTANASTNDELECIRAGMDDFVPKPIDPDRLTKAIARHALPQARERGAAE